MSQKNLFLDAYKKLNIGDRDNFISNVLKKTGWSLATFYRKKKSGKLTKLEAECLFSIFKSFGIKFDLKTELYGNARNLESAEMHNDCIDISGNYKYNYIK